MTDLDSDEYDWRWQLSCTSMSWLASTWQNTTGGGGFMSVASVSTARMPPCVLICEMAHHPAGMWYCCLIGDEYLLINHFQNIITVVCTVYFGPWLHKDDRCILDWIGLFTNSVVNFTMEQLGKDTIWKDCTCLSINAMMKFLHF